MDKQQIIAFIEGQLAIGNITKEDLAAMAGGIQAPQSVFVSAPVKEEKTKDLTNVFYGIGAIIAVIGVAILVAQNWEGIGFLGRVLVTLGISFVTYAGGLLVRNPEQKVLSQVLFTISAALAPLGSYVLLSEANIDFSWSSQLMTAAVLSVLFGSALLISRRNILILITIAFVSWAYFALLMKVFRFSYYDSEFLKWATMLLGASYIIIGYGLRSVILGIDHQDEKEKKAIQNILYGLGTLAVLGAGIFVGGLFDLLFIVLIFGAFYGSVYLKSRSMLTLGALFLMAHIIKLTSEYFVDSVGWPVALIGVGFLVIGVGFMTFYLNRTFIAAE